MSGYEGQLRIGLTISGAIALGAFEGGVLAALLAAAQAANRKRPGALQIDAIAGASAGSITGLLTARVLHRGQDPIDVMFAAWVTTPQLERLVDGGVSPLSVDATRASAEALLDGAGHLEVAQYAPIRLQMALGCLRGLDYRIGRISGPPIPANTYLDWAEWDLDGTEDAAWHLRPSGTVDAALASGAHAAAFPPYGLDRSAKEVMDRYEAQHIEHFPDSKYLWYTDGGTIDNEPLGRALDLTEAIDGDAAKGIGSASRLHLMITPDPPQPVIGDNRWSSPDRRPSWAATGLRAVKLMRSQRLYDDLRRAEKTNSRIEWTRQLEAALLDVVEGNRPDGEAALNDVTERIASQREGLLSSEDVRREAFPVPDTTMAAALHKAVAAATGLSGKREVAVSVISPRVLPEVADGSTAPRDLLASEVLGHFGGFLDVRLRENDFALGYRCGQEWLDQGGLSAHGLDEEVSGFAVAGTRAARQAWENTAGRAWVTGLGATKLSDLPFRVRLRTWRLGIHAGWMAFQQVRKGG
jgi:predicted acylesterase/phospholipase RssA